MIKKRMRKMPSMRRKTRVRQKVFGTPERPRLSVFRSNKHIYAQVINDTTGMTIVSASTRNPELRNMLNTSGNKDAAAKVGSLLAQKAKEANVEYIVFDRNRYRYHGRIKALADAAREGGLKF